ncbi:hypothetical protein KL935_000166 [Ogataea polymorpha]|nr:hypothetical protein KL908_000741 [Ogataea polymorpha]KAG7904027.1 hypothetical protein KL935_000166 [Ogataea polymorpha]
MGEIELKNLVVIITGAGGGLGRQYALSFASRGAKVVVNDLGGTLGGSGTSTKAADVVVDEIREGGGTAVANYDNVVTNPDGIVRTAVEAFGTVHVLINNAGILKDAAFKNMTEKQFLDVLDVHLNGAFKLTKLCWPLFRQQKFGRIIMTTSPAGLYGNFGQTNYSAAKMGLVGLAETLAKEGAKYNIRTNAIAPLAKSRMTETVMPPDVLKKLLPEKVAPLVLYLSSRGCNCSGCIFEVAAGLFAQIRWERSGGLLLKPDESLTPEAILTKFSQVTDFENPQYPTQLNDYNSLLEAAKKLRPNDQGSIRISSLKDKVVIITGAGSGLGRHHALWFARYGAKVVVNDLQDPSGVVDEIEQAGGTAVGARFNVYSETDKIVKTALDTFGTVNILVNNAGILRDRSFAKMTQQEWDHVIQIHLVATFRLCKLVWPIFLEQKGGCIINTTSTSGIYGNFGQANYAAAKAAVLSFTRSLSLEGAKANIRCNAIAPHAETSMTKTIFKSDELNKFSADQVSPLVVLLASDEVKVSGELYEVGAGWVGNTRWQRAIGAVSHDDHISPEFIEQHWAEITDFSKGMNMKSTQQSAMAILESVGSKDEDEDEEEEDEEEEEEEVASVRTDGYHYDHRQVILYNLSVGCHAEELKYVYENDDDFQAVPTFGVIPFLNEGSESFDFSDLVKNFDMTKLLHGEHYLKIAKQIPTSGKLRTKSFPVAVFNKHKNGKKNSLVIEGYETHDEKDELVFYNQGSYFIRNSETVSGKDKVFNKRSIPFLQNSFEARGPPDFESTYTTFTDQAALYRLNGDFNPLHIDPVFARGGNFSRPILHGLGTMGISAKLLMDHYGVFDEIKVRFTSVVYPGEQLRVLGWKSSQTVIFQTWSVDRNCLVIDRAGIRLKETKSKL